MNANAKRILIWSIVALAVAAGMLFALAPRAVPVDWKEIEPGPLTVTLDEEGETRVHDVFVLSSPVAGRVQRIEAHVGDLVDAGATVLANIEPVDPTLLDPRSQAQAKAAERAARSARELAVAEVEQAEAELDFAEAEYDRAHELILDGTISQRELDTADRNFRTGRAALATTRAALHMRDFELARAKALLLSPTEARNRDEPCDCIPITAPVGGRVLTIANPSERVVGAGEALLEIGNPEELEIVVDFLSADAVRIEPGQRVLIEGWGGESKLEGRVRRVEPFGFTKVSALGIEEQRVRVIVDLTSTYDLWRRLGHGYQVEVRVVLWEGDGVLAVPLTALFRHEERWAVFVADGSRARLREVQVGRRNGIDAEITAGIAAGEHIVLHPSDRVRDGVRIAERG